VNYFFELWGVSSLLAAVWTVEVLSGGESIATLSAARARLLCTGLAVAGLIALCLDVSRLLFHGRVGAITVQMTAAERRELESLIDWVRDGPRPVLSELTLLGLPWYTEFPGYSTDDYYFYHRHARARGLLVGDGFEGLILGHHFGRLVFVKDWPFQAVATEA